MYAVGAWLSSLGSDTKNSVKMRPKIHSHSHHSHCARITTTAGLVYRSQNFTCKATGTKLTLRTATVGVDPETGEKDVYLKGKEPVIKPSQVHTVCPPLVTL